jgi:superfamily II DNA or RNA helicase
MIKVLQTAITSRLAGTLDPAVVEAIDKHCSFMYAGSEFIPEVQQLLWDGCRHMFSVRTYSFPTGLTERICSVLDRHNVPYEIVPADIQPRHIQVPDLTLQMRDYQLETMEQTRKKSRGIIKLPTGAGKTLCYSGLIAEKKVPTIILVHRKELLYQTQTRIEKDLGIPKEDIGLIGDGHKEYKDISVAMIQTLMWTLGIVSKEFSEKDTTKVDPEIFHRYNMLISDEVHVLGANTFFKVSKAFRNTLYRYGGSATPIREETYLLVEGAIGPIIYNKSIADLKGKYLANIDVYFFHFQHSPFPKHVPYKDVYTREVVNNTDRNNLIKNVVEKCGEKKVLIAVRNVAHGHLLEQLIPNTVFVHGSLSTKKRRDILAKFEAGTIRRVIATVIWEQGLDIPSLDTLVDVRAEKSAIGFIQLIGRVMRKTPEKSRAVVIDIFDQGCRYISAHARERLELATKEIGDVHLVK